MKMKIALLAGLALAGSNAMACYTVYDGSNRVVFQSTAAPVDMSQPLHVALERRFSAGASMVFNQGAPCTTVSLAQVSRPASGIIPVNTIRMERSGTRQLAPSSGAPLLTDRTTALREGLPHTVVNGDIVMVQGAAAARATANMGTMTVIPADTALARAPDTRMMGAAAARPQTVITEMRDGNVTIQRN